MVKQIYDYEDRLILKDYDNGTFRTEKRYNLNGTIKEIVEPNGTTYFNYDNLGRLTDKWVPLDVLNDKILYTHHKIEYDKVGRIIKESVGKDAVENGKYADKYIENVFLYYNNGLLKEKQKSNGKAMMYEYDKDGNIIYKKIYEKGVNESLKQSREIFYENDYMGNVLSETIELRRGDIWGNDINNEQNKSITTHYTYDKNGNLKTKTTSDNITTLFEYDNLNRRLSITKPNFNEDEQAVNVKEQTKYDFRGNVIEEIDPRGNITNYEYDSRGRLTKIKEDVKLDGVIETIVTAYGYDNAGRKIMEISSGNYIEGRKLENLNRIEYRYDSMDRLLEKVYLGEVTKYNEERDKLTHKEVRRLQSTEEITLAKYTYDEKGNLIKEQDALGVAGNYGTEYTYNLQGAVKTILDPEAKQRGLSFTTKNVYDALGRVIEVHEVKGDSNFTQSYVSVTSYKYDDLGNVLKITMKKDSDSSEVVVKENTYDYLGNLQSTKTGDSFISYEYNALNKGRQVLYLGDETLPYAEINVMPS